MSQSEKAAYYKALKKAGVQFDKHYREYNTAELKQAYDRLIEEAPDVAVEAGLINPPPSDPPVAEPQFDPAATAAAYANLAEDDREYRAEPYLDEAHQAAAARPPVPPAPQPEAAPEPGTVPIIDRSATTPPQPQPVATSRNPNEMPGQRLNSKPEDEPIRIDENGLLWYQEEVRKPAYPKPRGRRVLDYLDSGTKMQTVQNGEYIETFEVAGDQPSRPAQVKITLPSYQVGIYKDPRFPFRIHVYNENRGFDLFEVQNYYGGSELVPTEIKRIYVENVLCYDIRTTIRAIQTEYRQLQLQGRI